MTHLIFEPLGANRLHSDTSFIYLADNGEWLPQDQNGSYYTTL